MMPSNALTTPSHWPAAPLEKWFKSPTQVSWTPSLRHEWEMSYPSSDSNPIREPEQKPDEEEAEEGLQEEEEARCGWDFHLSSIISTATSTRTASDALGAVELDPTDRLLATGGIARKIRIYKLSSLLLQEGESGLETRLLEHSAACEFYMCTPAKLSSLRWRPDSGGRVIGAGDYDGVVTEYDVDRRVSILERDEHGGRRVWSVAYSHCAPALGASGSDDGSVHIWDAREGSCARAVAAARPGGGAPVCCVEFDPLEGFAIGVGSADRRAYLYDVRSVDTGPTAVFEGHTRAVTYVRFAGAGQAVSSGADGSHRMWSAENGREVRVYRGHVNARSFVGMSVWRGGGLIGCGSESNEVFVYDLRWGEPIWIKGFGGGGEEEMEEDGRRFVSSVCWRQAGDGEEGTLVAGGSNGVLQVFVASRKPLLDG